MELKDKPKIEFKMQIAVDFANNYVEKQFRVFICDEMVEEFNKKHEKPNDARIWGKIITALKASGKIKPFGSRLYKPHNGGKQRFATEWISKLYSEQKSQNSKSKPGQINIEFDDN